MTATEAPWQNGMVERHGQVLGEIVSTMVDTSQLSGTKDMDMAGVFAAAAKNRRADATGHSARERVFGVKEKMPGSVIDALQEGENPAEMDEGWRDPVTRRSAQLRAEAQKAMITLDADQRWKKALATGVNRTSLEWTAGAQVFYWRAQKATQGLRGRRARMFARWHGPAIVLGRSVGTDQMVGNSYWVTHGGTLLLVAQEHLRSATKEEALAERM